MGSIHHTNPFNNSFHHNSYGSYLPQLCETFPSHKVEESTRAISHLAIAWKSSAFTYIAPPSFIQFVKNLWGHHGAQVGINSYHSNFISPNGN